MSAVGLIRPHGPVNSRCPGSSKPPALLPQPCAQLVPAASHTTTASVADSSGNG